MPTVNGAREKLPLSKIYAHRETVIEYLQLAVKDVLTEQQATRMGEIFKQAETDPLLCFLIDEADHIAGHELGLIDSDYIAEQQERLAQTLDRSWVQLIIGKSRLDEYAQLPPKTLEIAQTCLKERGLYDGSIDGVCGEETKAAFRRLEKQFYAELKRLGLSKTAEDNKSRSLDMIKAIELVEASEQENTADVQEQARLLILQTWLSNRS